MIDFPAREARRRSLALFATLSLCASIASAQLPSDVPSLAPMIEKVSPAVVNIAVSGSVKVDNPLAQDEFLRKFFDFDGQNPNGKREIEAAGSGVIVDAKKGYILTNHHVVENAEKITVTLADNRSLSAQVVGSDEGSDLAVLQVKDATLVQMPFGDSSKLRVGDYVVAIGNPFGFSNTVTSGIVSALGRSGINRDAYEDFIQTDASINPGNSGGNIGIGFAIPMNMARSIMDQLVTFGSVSRGLLGVNIEDITPDLAATYGLHDNSGALVKIVGPNSAAEHAGIQVGDVIVSINDHTVRDSGSLKAAIGLLRPGEKVAVGVIRDGHPVKVNATLGEAPAKVAKAAPADENRGSAPLDPAFEGAELADNDSGKVPGLLVRSVEPDSPAADRGLLSGDVITKVNRLRVHNLGEAKKAIEGSRTIILEIQRGGRNQLILMR
jgi:S1-C subfamily serine protease